MFDASSRKSLLHLLERRVFARTQMIHEHTHLDSTARGTIHSREDGLCLLVATGREIFDVYEPLSAVDILGDARKDGIVLREEFDSIAPQSRHTGQVGVQFDKWLVARWNLRIEDGSHSRLSFGFGYCFADEIAHIVLLG